MLSCFHYKWNWTSKQSIKIWILLNLFHQGDEKPGDKSQEDKEQKSEGSQPVSVAVPQTDGVYDDDVPQMDGIYDEDELDGIPEWIQNMG